MERTSGARPIQKSPRPGEAPPNLADYEAACRSHRWEDVRDALAGLPGGRGVNIAHEAVDRHLEELVLEDDARVGLREPPS